MIEERTLWVYNDLKAFLYIRMHDLQHKKDDIGGGNISAATVLFAYIGLLAKINYYIERPDKFNTVSGEVDETAAFIHFARQLKSNNIISSLPIEGESLRVMWNGFRNHLVHRFTVEEGKTVETYTFNYGSFDHESSLKGVLERHEAEEIFKHNGNERNWTVNGDAFHARLPQVSKFICDKIMHHDETDYTALKRALG